MKKNNLFAIVIIALAALLGSKLSLSIAWGAHTLYFSLFALLLPLLGMSLSLSESTLFITVLYGIKSLFFGTPITLGLPTLAATASWSVKQKKNNWSHLLNFTLHVLLPISCMALFISHPIGHHAFYYSWYWIIPVGIYLVEQKNNNFIFLKALQSTFVAHAVGSIIWLYRIPMTAEQWLNLIPVVAIERITFACATTLLFYSINYVTFSNLFRKKQEIKLT
jgi:hypothetical protein